MDGDLADDVRGGPEPVEAEPLAVAGQAQRPEPDQAGAQERRSLKVRVSLRDREGEALVDCGQLGVAAVNVVAGEPCPQTEVLAAREAVAALTVRPTEPGDADAVAFPEAIRAVSPRDHRSDHLVPRDERQLGTVELPVDDVEVGAAHPARVDADQHIAVTWHRLRDLGRLERRSRGLEDHRTHVSKPTLPSSAAAIMTKMAKTNLT